MRTHSADACKLKDRSAAGQEVSEFANKALQ